MEDWKEVQVHLLPTDKRSWILVNTYIDPEKHSQHPVLGWNYFRELAVNNSVSELEARGYKYQHMYLTSDEEIKDGNWYLRHYHVQGIFSGLKVFQWEDDGDKLDETCRKIVATDDPKVLKEVDRDNDKWQLFPSPTKEFIIDYCNNPVDKALVEYRDFFTEGNYSNTCTACGKFFHGTDKLGFICKDCGEMLLVNPDNTINIKRIKDSWSREEVEGIIEKIFLAFTPSSKTTTYIDGEVVDLEGTIKKLL